MANPFYVQPPNVLQALMAGDQGFQRGHGMQRQAMQDAARQDAARILAGGGDTRNVLAQLIGAGDVQSATAISNMDLARSNADWQRTYQGGMLDVARNNMKPEAVKTAEAAGIKPGTPEFTKAVFPKTDTPISATDKKAIFEAEDALPQLQGTKEALARAKEINDKTFTGYTAGIRGDIGTKLPGGAMLVDRNSALATSEWQKIMGPEALQAMASTLKGATTDFELRKFIEMLGDPSTDPKIRKSIIERMERLTDRKIELQQSRVKDLRGGSYFKPGGGIAPPQGAVDALKSNPALRDQFDAKYGAGAAAKALGQ